MCQEQGKDVSTTAFFPSQRQVSIQLLLIHWNFLLSLSLKCVFFNVEVKHWSKWDRIGHDNGWQQMASRIIVLGMLGIYIVKSIYPDSRELDFLKIHNNN